MITCCPSFLAHAHHDVACAKNVDLFTSTHASSSYASHEDCYVFDAAIVPFLSANLGTLLKLTTTSHSLLTSIIAATSIVVLRIANGLIVGFALAENRNRDGNTFHIMLHTPMNGTLLLTSRAWASVCGTRAWSGDTSWDTDSTPLTITPKRMFHACMFKPSLMPPIEVPPIEVLPETHDILACASDIAATYEKEMAATAKRASLFTRRLATMNAAKAGEKRARDVITHMEEQLAGAIVARRRAEAVCVRAEKELRECMKGE